MKHQVQGHILSADWRKTAPSFGRRKAPSAPARAGQIFERKAVQGLKRKVPVVSGPWIVFEDATGKHWAQPDILIFPNGTKSSRVLLLEVKLNFRAAATSELETLYLPLVEHLCVGLQVVPAVLCKRLTAEAQQHSVVSLAEVETVDEVEPWDVLFWDTATPLALRTQ